MPDGGGCVDRVLRVRYQAFMSLINIYNRGAQGPREIILDIVTTGGTVQDGHRIVEIAAIEAKGRRVTGVEFHAVVNPERDIPQDVVKAQGITGDEARKGPLFSEIGKQLRAFIGDSQVIIVSRNKDGVVQEIAFLNSEFEKAGVPPVHETQCVNIRRWSEAMFGDKNATLEKMLDRYGISRKDREGKTQGALSDARLLSEAYPKIFRDYIAFSEKRAQALSKGGKVPPAP